MTVVDGKSRQDIIPCLMATSLCPGSSPLGLLAPTAASAPVALLQICQTVCRRRNGRNISRCCFWRHGFAASASRWGSPRASSFWPKACRVFWQLLQELDAASTCLQEMTLTLATRGTQKMGAGICIKLGFHKLDPNSLTTFSLVRRQVKTRLCKHTPYGVALATNIALPLGWFDPFGKLTGKSINSRSSRWSTCGSGGIGASDRCEATAPCLCAKNSRGHCISSQIHARGFTKPCWKLLSDLRALPAKRLWSQQCTNVQRLQHISALRRYVNQLHLLPLCRLHDLLWQVARRTVQQQDTLFAWIQLQHLTNVRKSLHQVRSRSPWQTFAQWSSIGLAARLSVPAATCASASSWNLSGNVVASLGHL